MWIRLYQFLSSLIHFAKSDRNSSFASAACRILALCSHVQNAKNGFIQGDKISHIQYDKSNCQKKKKKKIKCLDYRS